MPNAQNKDTLAKIKEELEGINALWVVDYRGLTVKQVQQLRREIREAGAHLTVYKNTLMKIALAEADNDKLVIKGGLLEGKVCTAQEVEAIASLPSREQLLAQIAGAINGVARGLATTINGVPSGLARAISQVAEQKPAA